jgi:hypothetical protein
MPYQQLHAEIPVDAPSVGARGVPQGVRLRTAISLAMVAAGLGLGGGSILTVGALTKVEAANRIPPTVAAHAIDMPPLPNFPVRGVSSGKRFQPQLSPPVFSATYWHRAPTH